MVLEMPCNTFLIEKGDQKKDHEICSSFKKKSAYEFCSAH